MYVPAFGPITHGNRVADHNIHLREYVRNAVYYVDLVPNPVV